jgi:hypothetical protein
VVAKFRDLSGQRFGLLEAKEQTGRDKSGAVLWRCLCRCGGETVVTTGDLRRGNTASCGCLRTTHGHTRGKDKRGYQSATAEYTAWRSMRSRCNNPAFKGYEHYGARGIRVCPEWEESFEAFYTAVGPRPSPKHSIHRIDNDAGYVPDNVCWALPLVQANNKRNVSRISIDGRAQTVAEWAREAGLNKHTLFGRIELGWPEEALLIPAGSNSLSVVGMIKGVIQNGVS